MNEAPRGFCFRGKYWSVNKRINGARVRLTTRQTTLEAAVAWWDARKDRAKSMAAARVSHTDRSEALTLYNSARSRARKRGVEFSLTQDDVLLLFARSRGRCEVTGIPFSNVRIGLCRRAPFRPSLDRITPGGGYAVGNVRLVCVAVNTALGEWGDAIFRQIAAAFLGHDSRTQNQGS